MIGGVEYLSLVGMAGIVNLEIARSNQAVVVGASSLVVATNGRTDISETVSKLRIEKEPFHDANAKTEPT